MSQNYEFGQSQIQNELQNTQHSLFYSNISGKSQYNIYASTRYSLNQNNLQNSNLQQYQQIEASVEGLVIKLDEETLQSLKEVKIKQIKDTLGLDSFNENVKFPDTNLKAQANGLMDLRADQVKRDIESWLYESPYSPYQMKKNVQNNINEYKYKYIRYFYFKNTESFKKDYPDQDYGQKIVKYKNQITVMIGIIENFLNQPIQYFGVFKSFLQQFQNFQNSYQEAVIINNAQELKNVLISLTKERINKRESLDCKHLVNQKLYCYLNSKYEPLEVLMKFVKFLLLFHQIDYKAEDMSIFQKAFQVNVISFINSKITSTGKEEQSAMQLGVIFEHIISPNYDFQNCYLLYDYTFDESFKDIPFECIKCNATELNSIKYVKEFQSSGRFCFNCS
ncbi:hypothetical protein ABPG74_000870 [Tetrahymena malaccensis]